MLVINADVLLTICCRDVADDQGSGISSMMQDLAFAIPGVDEAMGFAEVMKYVSPWINAVQICCVLLFILTPGMKI